MRRSRMMEKLKRGEHVTLAQSFIIPHWRVVDLIGLVGFDGIWIEYEHSDFTYAEISHMMLAARAHDMDAVVRVTRCGYTDIIKPFEAGATGIVVPHCKDGEDAAGIAREAKFAPIGKRGAGGSVDADYGTHDYMEYVRHANAETFVVALIEDREAIEDIDVIAGTEGIDILMLGPHDLSQSYGIFGQTGHKLIKDAIDAVADACTRHGKWWGLPIANREHAREMLKKGARVLQTRHDQQVLIDGYRALKASFEGIAY